MTELDDRGIPHRLLLTSWSLHLQFTFTKINAKAPQLNNFVPNADSWAANPFILYFLALTGEIHSPQQSCTSSSRSAAVAMWDFAWTWGSSAVGVVQHPAYHMLTESVSFPFKQPSKVSFPATASVSSLTKAKQEVTRSWCAVCSTFCSFLLDNARIWTWGHSSCSGRLSAHWNTDRLV